jgi:hypothetical protein
LKDLFIEMTKGKQQPSKQSAYRPKWCDHVLAYI